jgi:hypothetical protein
MCGHTVLQVGMSLHDLSHAWVCVLQNHAVHEQSLGLQNHRVQLRYGMHPLLVVNLFLLLDWGKQGQGHWEVGGRVISNTSAVLSSKF